MIKIKRCKKKRNNLQCKPVEAKEQPAVHKVEQGTLTCQTFVSHAESVYNIEIKSWVSFPFFFKLYP